MMQGNILIKWIHENEGYEYYENSRFLSLFLDCAIEKVCLLYFMIMLFCKCSFAEGGFI